MFREQACNTHSCCGSSWRKSNTMTKGPMSGVSNRLMTNVKECYNNVLAQSQTIAELLLEGQYANCQRFDMKYVHFQTRRAQCHYMTLAI